MEPGAWESRFSMNSYRVNSPFSVLRNFNSKIVPIEKVDKVLEILEKLENKDAVEIESKFDLRGEFYEKEVIISCGV